MPTSRSRFLCRRPARGSVIVLVLVTLLLAAFLLAAFIRRTGTELLADARATERRQLRAEAYSALESMLAVLAAQRAVDGALHSPDEHWADVLAAAGYTPAGSREVIIEFEDESGKISLPRADAITVQSALEGAGVMAVDAERMTNALLAWMREGDRHEPPDLDAPEYEANDPAYLPARRSLRSWGELAAVEMNRHVFFDEYGAATEVLRTFIQDFSLHAFARTNINSASTGVLLTMGLGEPEADRLLEYRNRPRRPDETGYFRSLNEAAAIVGPAVTSDNFSAEMQALRLNLTVRQGAVAFRLTAVIALSGDGPRPSRAGAVTPPDAAATPPVERKRLDYPFAVLEIGEDIEIPEAPVPIS